MTILRLYFQGMRKRGTNSDYNKTTYRYKQGGKRWKFAQEQQKFRFNCMKQIILILLFKSRCFLIIRVQ